MADRPVPSAYTCLDCGVGVIAFSEGLGPRCSVCTWIRDMSPAEQEIVRNRLYDREAMQHWRKFGCYHDESFPERPCDHCGRRYQGPAVYCCLACATAL